MRSSMTRDCRLDRPRGLDVGARSHLLPRLHRCPLAGGGWGRLARHDVARSPNFRSGCHNGLNLDAAGPHHPRHLFPEPPRPVRRTDCLSRWKYVVSGSPSRLGFLTRD